MTLRIVNGRHPVICLLYTSLGKPRYDFEKDETVLVLSDGRASIRLVAVFNDAGQITHSWPEEYMTLMVRDLEKN